MKYEFQETTDGMKEVKFIFSEYEIVSDRRLYRAHINAHSLAHKFAVYLALIKEQEDGYFTKFKEYSLFDKIRMKIALFFWS